MSLSITLKVVPSSGRQKIVLDKNGMIKCYLLSQPERGQANKELIAFLAESLGLAKQLFEISGGLTARTKRITIFVDLTLDEVMHKLGLKTGQKTIF